MPARVYLDQFAWVGVAKAHHGKSTDWADALDAMREAKKRGAAVFPISLSHVNETVKRAEDGSRGRLLDVMAELWDANAIRPWSQMRRPEIRNMVKKRLGLPQEDLDAWAFGRGIGHVLGGEYRFIPKHANADPAQLTRALPKLVPMLMSPDRLLDYKDPDMAKTLREEDPADDTFIRDLQKAVDAEKKVPRTGSRRDAATGIFLMTMVVDPMFDVLKAMGVDPKPFLAKHMSTREQMEAMLRDLPTMRTFHELTFARNASRPLKVNDVWDLSLSNAIPYCDLVVTERAWCEFARQAGLDTDFGTTLCTSPEDFATALRAL